MEVGRDADVKYRVILGGLGSVGRALLWGFHNSPPEVNGQVVLAEITQLRPRTPAMTAVVSLMAVSYRKPGVQGRSDRGSQRGSPSKPRGREDAGRGAPTQVQWCSKNATVTKNPGGRWGGG